MVDKPSNGRKKVPGGTSEDATAAAADLPASAPAVTPLAVDAAATILQPDLSAQAALVASPVTAPPLVFPASDRYMDDSTLIKSRPYHNAAVVAVLRSLFVGASSPGVVHQDLFVSSVSGKDEKEIPRSMLAMVAALVHFCIGEWAEGVHVHKKFDGGVVCEEYNKNIETLDTIAKHPLKYHRLMSDLYKLATTNAPKTVASGPSELDIDGMAE
ncbi:hypothetical protein PQX77_020286 [Marasmius sp. AFHP31]|nr:hypothetical protein PQX77_020286 [Marasmius sp. AFHP31]